MQENVRARSEFGEPQFANSRVVWKKKRTKWICKKEQTDQIYSPWQMDQPWVNPNREPDSSATINLDFPSGRVTIDREREGAERGFHRYYRVVVNEDSPELWHEQSGHNEILRIQTIRFTRTCTEGKWDKTRWVSRIC